MLALPRQPADDAALRIEQRLHVAVGVRRLGVEGELGDARHLLEGADQAGIEPLRAHQQRRVRIGRLARAGGADRRDRDQRGLAVEQDHLGRDRHLAAGPGGLPGAKIRDHAHDRARHLAAARIGGQQLAVGVDHAGVLVAIARKADRRERVREIGAGHEVAGHEIARCVARHIGEDITELVDDAEQRGAPLVLMAGVALARQYVAEDRACREHREHDQRERRDQPRHLARSGGSRARGKHAILDGRNLTRGNPGPTRSRCSRRMLIGCQYGAGCRRGSRKFDTRTGL